MTDTATIPPANPPALTWIGRFLAVAPALMLTMSGVMKLMKPDMVTEGFAKMGYPESAIVPLGVIELVATLLYLIPQTSVLGAVLLTGYLGGATATHVQAGDAWAQIFTAPVLGAVLWLSLVLRDYRMRQLLPIRWAMDPTKKTPVLQKVFVVAALAVIAAMAYVAQRPDQFTISRSIQIAAPPDTVFPHMNDLRKSMEWSPWAKLDPNMKSTFEGPDAGEGAKYHWVSDQQNVGEGKMTIVESRPNELVKCELEFIKPMQGKSTVDFILQPEGDGTVVTWKMYGKQQFMEKAFCMFMDMDKMVGGDFEKGLQNLKSLVETPSTP